VRSILRERSTDFFVILQHDKADWYDFWVNYCNENEDFMEGYAEHFNLDEKKIREILNEFDRPFLDKIKQKNEQIRHLKHASARGLNKNNQKLELIKEDFVIFLIGALGLDDAAVIEKNGKNIILIDLVSLGKNDRIDGLENVVLNSAYTIREEINKKEKNLEEI
jgi:GAF domain-containing protein